MNVLMFSGQGSQYYGMGHALYARNATFRRHLDRLDRRTTALTGVSVVARLYDKRMRASDPLDDISLSSPAIFMVELALARTLVEAGLPVAMTLGASLGAFAALTVAGMLDEQDALEAVLQLTRDTCTDATMGGMIAILASPTIHDDPFLRNNSEIAAINFASHFVIAVTADRIDAVEAYLAECRLLFQRLPVHFPFHSQAMERLEGRARAALVPFHRRPATMPFVCCAQARTLTRLPLDYVWTLIRRPILFRDTLVELEKVQDHTYVDVGPSGTLATFAGYLLPHAKARIAKIMDPLGDDEANLAAVLRRHGGRSAWDATA